MTFDPRTELIAEYQAAKAAGNQKLAMSILLNIGKIDNAKNGAAEPEAPPLPLTLESPAAVYAYLVQQGWKISERSVYNHVEGRKLVPQADGSFSVIDVDAYAVANLVNNPLRAEKTSSDELSLEAKQLENRRLRMKVEQQEGSLINSDEVKRELENMLVTFRSRILLIPRKLSSQIAMMTDQHKVEEVLSRELRDTLTTLSQFHADVAE